MGGSACVLDRCVMKDNEAGASSFWVGKKINLSYYADVTYLYERFKIKVAFKVL